MTRKSILAAWFVIFLAMITSMLLIATSVMWLPCYMIMPELAKPIGEMIMKQFMHEMSKVMFRATKSPNPKAKFLA